jgi:hypothetical protein
MMNGIEKSDEDRGAAKRRTAKLFQPLLTSLGHWVSTRYSTVVVTAYALMILASKTSTINLMGHGSIMEALLSGEFYNTYMHICLSVPHHFPVCLFGPPGRRSLPSKYHED